MRIITREEIEAVLPSIDLLPRVEAGFVVTGVAVQDIAIATAVLEGVAARA